MEFGLDSDLEKFDAQLNVSKMYDHTSGSWFDSTFLSSELVSASLSDFFSDPDFDMTPVFCEPSGNYLQSVSILPNAFAMHGEGHTVIKCNVFANDLCK